LVKAYETHGNKVSRMKPHHVGVTKTWSDIYRYVASTAWGQAAGLKSGLKNEFPIYQKPEHAFPRSASPSKGNHDGR
jgi:hypothetical protein